MRHPGTPPHDEPDGPRSRAVPRCRHRPARCGAQAPRSVAHMRRAAGGRQRYGCSGPAPARKDPTGTTGGSSSATAHPQGRPLGRAPRSPPRHRPYRRLPQNREAHAAAPARGAYRQGPPWECRGCVRSVRRGTPATGVVPAHRKRGTRRPAPLALPPRTVPCDAGCPPSNRHPSQAFRADRTRPKSTAAQPVSAVTDLRGHRQDRPESGPPAVNATQRRRPPHGPSIRGPTTPR